MKNSRFTDEQITYPLRQAESGMPVADLFRQLGVSKAGFYVCKAQYAEVGLTDLRSLRQLRDEDIRLERLVADLTLNKHILSESWCEKRFEAGQARALVSWTKRLLTGEHPEGMSSSAFIPFNALPQEPG